MSVLAKKEKRKFDQNFEWLFFHVRALASVDVSLVLDVSVTASVVRRAAAAVAVHVVVIVVVVRNVVVTSHVVRRFLTF